MIFPSDATATSQTLLRRLRVGLCGVSV